MSDTLRIALTGIALLAVVGLVDYALELYWRRKERERARR